MYPFFNVVSYLLVLPLYTLHTLVLWYIVFNYGRGEMYVLFPAGAIFGLYEAYITKVLWNPTWSEAAFKIGGVAVIETMVLVLFWHAFLAFILPLFLAETYLTSSREILEGLPEWLRAWVMRVKNGRLVYLVPFIAGFFQASGSSSVEYSLGSGILNSAVLILLVAYWRRIGGNRYTMRELLPGRRAFIVLGVLLALDYIILGFLLRPEEIPDLASQASIWVLYVFFDYLLFRGLEKSRNHVSGQVEWEGYPSIRYMVSLSLLFTLGSVIGFFTGLFFVAAFLVWILGILFGLKMLVWTMREVL